MARPLIRLPVRVQRDAEHIGSNFPSSSSALRQGESIPALYAGLVPSHHTAMSGGVLCLLWPLLTPAPSQQLLPDAAPFLRNACGAGLPG